VWDPDFLPVDRRTCPCSYARPSRLPISTADVADATEHLDVVALALADGKIVGDEAKALAKAAGGGGMGAEQARGLNERFLEMMREAAFSDQILTVEELRVLLSERQQVLQRLGTSMIWSPRQRQTRPEWLLLQTPGHPRVPGCANAVNAARPATTDPSAPTKLVRVYVHTLRAHCLGFRILLRAPELQGSSVRIRYMPSHGPRGADRINCR
jgi:hypothetical protein